MLTVLSNVLPFEVAFISFASNPFAALKMVMTEVLANSLNTSTLQIERRKRLEIREFDGPALFNALEAKRTSQGLSWPQVADEIWNLSYVLNDRRHDHPISPSTIKNIQKRGTTSCQHALFFLRWLNRSPESFLPGASPDQGPKLPDAGPDRRLRWDLHLLYDALNNRRQERKMTWPELAKAVRGTPSQLSGLRTVRFAIEIRLAMRIVQWVERPSTDFVYAAEW
jgi:hypothetical protein